MISICSEIKHSKCGVPYAALAICLKPGVGVDVGVDVGIGVVGGDYF